MRGYLECAGLLSSSARLGAGAPAPAAALVWRAQRARVRHPTTAAGWRVACIVPERGIGGLIGQLEGGWVAAQRSRLAACWENLPKAGLQARQQPLA